MSRATHPELVALDIKFRVFAGRVLLTTMLFACVCLLGLRDDLQARPYSYVVAVLLISSLIIWFSRAARTLRSRSSLRRSMPVIPWQAWNEPPSRELVETAATTLMDQAAHTNLEAFREVVAAIETAEAYCARKFANERQRFHKIAVEYAIAVFEDDRDQTGTVLVKSVLKRLGFLVLDVEQVDNWHLNLDPAAFTAAAAPADHFVAKKADLVIVGTKITEELLKRYLNEVYRWGDPKLLFIADLGNSSAELLGGFQFVLTDFSPLFRNLILNEIWISLKFWQVQSDQRRRLYAPRPAARDHQRFPFTD